MTISRIKSFIAGQDWRKLFVFILFTWAVVNILQAIFMEMMKDESYYYLWGKNLAWGYYDHPPMVAVMTWLSSIFFDGNLGVRFMNVISQMLTIVLIWKTLEEKMPDAKKVMLFFIITASMVMFTAYGFITAPDVPFLLFTALFLFVYQRFLKAESLANTLLLGIAIAGMIYSKYHAALIIGFVVLSNFKLLIRPKAWLAVFLAVILLIPHIYWQISMNFPSFKYHLSGRNVAFQWKFFFDYLPNQLVVFNPFTFGAVVYLIVKHRAKDTFERALYFLIIGLFFFFWSMAFRGHVEPHWTVAATIPMIILLYNKALVDGKLRRFAYKWIAPSIILVVIARALLLTDLLPERAGFSGKQLRSEAIQSVAGELPVVFTGSFQNPSLYSFFTKRESFVLSAVNSRRTQFDIWQKELEHQGSPVFIVQQREGISQRFEVNGHVFYGYFADNFQTVNRVRIDYILPQSEVRARDNFKIDIEIHNPTDRDIDFFHAEFPVRIAVAFAPIPSGNVYFYEAKLNEKIKILPAQSSLNRQLSFVIPEIESGNYRFTITLFNEICYARNADFKLITITDS